MAPATYGYIWSDWLYGARKDAFMVDVYDACAAIDREPDVEAKREKMAALGKVIKGSERDWVLGIRDFLSFEQDRMVHGLAPLTILGLGDDFAVLAVIDGAYRHGAFRGLCRTPGGAEWIGVLGEVCAAMVHQGFKWLRSASVDEWELPALGEAWCKGVVMWGLASVYLAVDAAGDDADNDEALYRIHTVVAAHHMAGTVWTTYRGPHPHQWWDRAVRGKAPTEYAIRQFAAWRCWPLELTDLLVRSAQHVNTWVNPHAPSAHQARMRGLALGAHTPRLNIRLNHVVDELAELAGDMTPQEITEVRSRVGSWLSTHTSVWRGRGDTSDRVVEISLLGAMLGVLRETRPHITPELVDRLTQWSRARTEHLRPEEQRTILDEVAATAQIRGRLPGVPLGSDGVGPRRYTDGVWGLASLGVVYARHGGREVPEDMRELTVRLFHAMTEHRRIPGVDVGKNHVGSDCMVCVGDQLFKGLVDNRPSTGVLTVTIWGALTYCNLGLGAGGDDVDLATR
ncbi:hypothetical protein BB31_08505 [Amycolatopsis lurida NRRL 2430]|uniref:Uncharacterized protein n=1 Tax=Amycolatopsis lurida NRRL 2430 TaxID=1460371 RepID=A0A2P2FYS7_AMYLU|nr:hypothetical protein BB31_08505 [Amycolatopsis lurida NRRL 2430]